MAKWFKRGDSGSDAEPEPWWRGGDSEDWPAAGHDAGGVAAGSDSAESAESELSGKDDAAPLEDAAAGDVEPQAEDVAQIGESSVPNEESQPEDEVSGEVPAAPPASAGAPAGGGFVAGLTGRFKRKKTEGAVPEAEAPEPTSDGSAAEADAGIAAAAVSASAAEPHPETPATAAEEAPATEAASAAASEEQPPPGEPAGEQAEPEFPAEPAPAVSMPEEKPGLFGGLKSRFKRKTPADNAPPVVPSAIEPGEGTAEPGAEAAAAAVAAGAVVGAAEAGVTEGGVGETGAAETGAAETGAGEVVSEAAAAQEVSTEPAVDEAATTEVLPSVEPGVLPELGAAPAAEALPPVEPVFMTPAPPPPATLIAGSSLVAVVSRGPDPATPPLSMIPNVTGLPQEEALDGLQELGVAAQIVLAYSSEVKQGRVIAQYPTPGTPFPENQTAVLVVSRGQAAVPHVVVLPNLTGLAEHEAEKEIRQLGLEPFTVDAHDPEVPPGTVLCQVPSADSLAVAPVQRRRIWPWLLGAAIVVLLAFGAFLFWRLNATYPVPSVIGQTQVTAQQTIEDAGFTVGSVISSPVAGVPRGAVATQAPAANAPAKLRSSVTLVVSSGEPLVAIPNVVGKSESQATTDLAAVDLTNQVVRAYDATVPAGNVVSQFPIAGDQVLPNTVIGLIVSRGRPPSIGATVPNVAGMTQSKATSTVKNAKLTSQVFTVPSATVSSGLVVGQLPPPGSLVAKSSQVYLFVSRGRVSSTTTLTASVPNLIGQTQIQAITNINSAGLIAVVSQAYSSAIPPGIVYAQVPQPGAIVSRETQVGIIVSQGPAPQQ